MAVAAAERERGRRRMEEEKEIMASKKHRKENRRKIAEDIEKERERRMGKHHQASIEEKEDRIINQQHAIHVAEKERKRRMDVAANVAAASTNAGKVVDTMLLFKQEQARRVEAEKQEQLIARSMETLQRLASIELATKMWEAERLRRMKECEEAQEESFQIRRGSIAEAVAMQQKERERRVEHLKNITTEQERERMEMRMRAITMATEEQTRRTTPRKKQEKIKVVTKSSMETTMATTLDPMAPLNALRRSGNARPALGRHDPVSPRASPTVEEEKESLQERKNNQRQVALAVQQEQEKHATREQRSQMLEAMERESNRKRAASEVDQERVRRLSVTEGEKVREQLTRVHNQKKAFEAVTREQDERVARMRQTMDDGAVLMLRARAENIGRVTQMMEGERTRRKREELVVTKREEMERMENVQEVERLAEEERERRMEKMNFYRHNVLQDKKEREEEEKEKWKKAEVLMEETREIRIRERNQRLAIRMMEKERQDQMERHRQVSNEEKEDRKQNQQHAIHLAEKERERRMAALDGAAAKAAAATTNADKVVDTILLFQQEQARRVEVMAMSVRRNEKEKRLQQMEAWNRAGEEQIRRIKVNQRLRKEAETSRCINRQHSLDISNMMFEKEKERRAGMEQADVEFCQKEREYQQKKANGMARREQDRRVAERDGEAAEARRTSLLERSKSMVRADQLIQKEQDRRVREKSMEINELRKEEMKVRTLRRRASRVMAEEERERRIGSTPIKMVVMDEVDKEEEKIEAAVTPIKTRESKKDAETMLLQAAKMQPLPQLHPQLREYYPVSPRASPTVEEEKESLQERKNNQRQVALAVQQEQEKHATREQRSQMLEAMERESNRKRAASEVDQERVRRLSVTEGEKVREQLTRVHNQKKASRVVTREQEERVALVAREKERELQVRKYNQEQVKVMAEKERARRMAESENKAGEEEVRQSNQEKVRVMVEKERARRMAETKTEVELACRIEERRRRISVRSVVHMAEEEKERRQSERREAEEEAREERKRRGEQATVMVEEERRRIKMEEEMTKNQMKMESESRWANTRHMLDEEKERRVDVWRTEREERRSIETETRKKREELARLGMDQERERRGKEEKQKRNERQQEAASDRSKSIQMVTKLAEDERQRRIKMMDEEAKTNNKETSSSSFSRHLYEEEKRTQVQEQRDREQEITATENEDRRRSIQYAENAVHMELERVLTMERKDSKTLKEESLKERNRSRETVATLLEEEEKRRTNLMVELEQEEAADRRLNKILSYAAYIAEAERRSDMKKKEENVNAMERWKNKRMVTLLAEEERRRRVNEDKEKKQRRGCYEKKLARFSWRGSAFMEGVEQRRRVEEVMLNPEKGSPKRCRNRQGVVRYELLYMVGRKEDQKEIATLERKKVLPESHLRTLQSRLVEGRDWLKWKNMVIGEKDYVDYDRKEERVRLRRFMGEEEKEMSEDELDVLGRRIRERLRRMAMSQTEQLLHRKMSKESMERRMLSLESKLNK